MQGFLTIVPKISEELLFNGRVRNLTRLASKGFSNQYQARCLITSSVIAHRLGCKQDNFLTDIKKAERRRQQPGKIDIRLVTSRTGIVSAPTSSPFDSNTTNTKSKRKGRRRFIPPKAAVEMTPKARNFFKLLLENPPRSDIIGIMLNFNQASSGQPRMVFSFDYVTKEQVHEDDEGVSLELLEDGSPKPPKDSVDDGLPKLYVSHNALLKVLGCKVDVDIDNMQPIIYNKEGLEVNPND